MTSMDDLITWLRAQLDKDERMAQAVPGSGTWRAYAEGGDDGWAVETEPDGDPSATIGGRAMARHIARWDPATVLRRIEADRAVLKHLEGMLGSMARDAFERGAAIAEDFHAFTLLRKIATTYADQPGYREEWRPKTTRH